jgi:hypothetical protein
MDQDIVPVGIIDNGLNDPFDDNMDKDLWFEDRKKLYPFDDYNWLTKL